MRMNFSKIFKNPIDEKVAKLDCDFITSFQSINNKEILVCLKKNQSSTVQTATRFFRLNLLGNKYL